MKKYIMSIICSFVLLVTLGAGCDWFSGQTDNNTTPTTTPNNNDIPDISPVMISSPEANETVGSPIAIEGEIPGNWATEGQLYITIENEDGDILGATTTMVENWMTEDLVEFEASVEYAALEEQEAVIVIHKGNPAGMPSQADSVEWPITVEEATDTIVFSTWETEDLSNPDVTVTVPAAFESDRTTTGTVRYYFYGETQVEDTELYDGILISLGMSDIPTDQTFVEHVQEIYTEDSESPINEEISASITETQIDGRTTYTYTYESISVIEKYFVEVGNDQMLEIHISAPDPENIGYAQVIDMFLRELEV